ncbi:hypothetical protein D3C72_909510 [compost metagenome]
MIDIWRKNCNIHVPALIEIRNDEVNFLTHPRGKNSCHEVRRIVDLEIHGLISKDGVAVTVGGVKAVATKGFDLFPNTLCNFLRISFSTAG